MGTFVTYGAANRKMVYADAIQRKPVSIHPGENGRLAGGSGAGSGGRAGGGIVDITRDRIQFDCMDSLPQNASSPRVVWIGRYTKAILTGLLVGAVCAVGYVYIPYNRVVVWNQPTSTVVKLSSVHLAKGGFVVIYYAEPSGSFVLGHSSYLPAGYYRSLAIPFLYKYALPDIDHSSAGQLKTGFALEARLFYDTGDRVFEEFKDTPVTDWFGHVYRVPFFMIYNSVFADTRNYITAYPFLSVMNVLFP